MNYQVSQERQAHLHYLKQSIDRLQAVSPKWSEAERKRGEATIRNLERQIEDVHANIYASLIRPAMAS